MAGERTLKVTILGDADKLKSAFGAAGDASDGFGSRVDEASKKVAAFGAAFVGAGVVGAGALYKLGSDFDGAYDNIQTKTGATGAQLDKLKDSFRNVVKDVPVDFGKASDAIATLSQRTGLTGKPLDDLSKTVLNLNRLTGSDLTSSLDKLTRMLGDAGVPANQMQKALDEVFTASQKSGVSFDKLAEKATAFGGPMRQLGFSFDETVALLAKFEKEGVNTDLVMGSLRIALGKMAKGGVDAKEGLEKAFTEIKNAKSPTEATAAAIALFGQKAGPDMAAAIREGRFEIGDLVKAMQSGGGAINSTAADTDDASQKMQVALNKIKVAAEPVASAVFDLAGKIADKLAPAIDAVVSWVDKLSDAFQKDGLNGALVFARTEFGKLLDKLGPVGDALRDAGRALSAIVDVVRQHIPETIAAIAGVATVILINAVPAIVAMTSAWIAETAAMIAANAPIVAIAAAVAALAAGVVWAYQNVDWFRAAVDALASFMTDTVWPAIKKVADFFMDTFVPAVVAIWDKISGFGGWLKDVFTGQWGDVWRGIKDTFEAIWNGFVSFLTDWLPNKFLPKLGEIATKLLAWIVDVAPKAAEKLLEWTAEFIGWAAGLFVKMGEALAGFIADLLAWIVDRGPDLVLKLAEWTGKFVVWGAELWLKIAEKMAGFIADLLKWIADSAPKLPGELLKWTAKFVDFAAGLPGALASAMAGLLSWIGDQAQNLTDVLADWTTKFVSWVAGLGKSASSAILSFAGDVGQKIVDFIMSHINPMNWGGGGSTNTNAQTLQPELSATGQQIFFKDGKWYDFQYYQTTGQYRQVTQGLTPAQQARQNSGGGSQGGGGTVNGGTQSGTNSQGGAIVEPPPGAVWDPTRGWILPNGQVWTSTGTAIVQNATQAVQGIFGGGTGGGDGYSPTEIAQLAKTVGFTGNAARIMGAIGYAESGGDPDILGDLGIQTDTWGPSVGLTQVRSLKAEDHTGRTRDRYSLTNPTFNLRSAYSISDHGTKFSPWTMYTNGRYQQYLGQIPALASGGVVKARPGGTLALIAEAGQDEAVVPLPRGGDGASIGPSIVINVHGSLVGGSPREVALALRDELIRAKREGVTIGLG